MNNLNNNATKQSRIHTIISKLVFIYKNKGHKIDLDIYNKEINDINSNIADIEEQILSLDKSVKSSLDNYNYISKYSYNTMNDYVDEEVLAKSRKHTLDTQLAYFNLKKDNLLHTLKDLKSKKETLISYYE